LPLREFSCARSQRHVLLYCNGCAIEKMAILRKITQNFAQFLAMCQKSLGNFTKLREIPHFLSPSGEYPLTGQSAFKNLPAGKALLYDGTLTSHALQGCCKIYSLCVYAFNIRMDRQLPTNLTFLPPGK
jgi:hypothetical protein